MADSLAMINRPAVAAGTFLTATQITATIRIIVLPDPVADGIVSVSVSGDLVECHRISDLKESAPSVASFVQSSPTGDRISVKSI